MMLRQWQQDNVALLYILLSTSSFSHALSLLFILGSWVAVQRKEYKLPIEGKPSRMTHGKITRLESISFEWVARRGD